VQDLAYILSWVIVIFEIYTIYQSQGVRYLNYARKNWAQFEELNEVVLDVGAYYGFSEEQILYGEVELDYETYDLDYYEVDTKLYDSYVKYNANARDYFEKTNLIRVIVIAVTFVLYILSIFVNRWYMWSRLSMVGALVLYPFMIIKYLVKMDAITPNNSVLLVIYCLIMLWTLYIRLKYGNGHINEFFTTGPYKVGYKKFFTKKHSNVVTAFYPMDQNTYDAEMKEGKDK